MFVGMMLVCLIVMRMSCTFGLTNADGFPRGSLLGPSVLVRFGMKHFDHQIPESESGNTVHAYTCIERNDPSFCRTVGYWCLFLAHPTYWHTRVTSETTQDPSWCRFWVFKVSCKIRVLKQSKSALLCCVSHITLLLPVFTCVMNVWDQTCWAFVIGFGPFRHRTSKFVHGPQNIRSPNTSQV